MNPGTGENVGVDGPTRGAAGGGSSGGERGRVRRATFADLDAIMDINDNIYEGLDYLPALFYIFMQSREYDIYVYELDRQLVALTGFYFVPATDDLVTIVFTRVRPSFQGQGFGRPEKNPITDQFRRDHPQVTRFMIQTLLKPNIQTKIEKWKAQLQEASFSYHWNYLPYRLTNRHQLATFSTQRQRSNAQTKPTMLSYTEGSDWLKRSDKLVNFLSRYSEEYVVAGAKWIPVKVNATELQKLFANNIAFVTFTGKKCKSVDGNLTLKESTDEISILEDDEIAGFSSSNIFPCKYGVNFEIHFYGDSEVDLLSHVYSHMQHYVSVLHDDVRIGCSLHFPLSIDSNRVEESLREELGEIYRSEYYFVTQAVHYITPFGPL